MANNSDNTVNLAPLRRTRRVTKPSLRAQESLFASTLAKKGFVASVASSEDEEWNIEDSPVKSQILHVKNDVKNEDMFKFQKSKKKNLFEVFEKVLNDSDSEYEDTESSSSQSSSEAAEELTVAKSTLVKNGPSYTINTEDYFNAKTNKTSANTLNKLQNPVLTPDEVQQLLACDQSHLPAINQLIHTHETLFNKWLYLLENNFSIVLYGVGSKMCFLAQFHKLYLKNQLTLVINGFFSALTIKNVLEDIILGLLDLKESPSNLNEAVKLILKEIEPNERHIYLLINNIEGLKAAKSQEILATLANSPKIHLICTMDHVNAALMWDQAKLSKLNAVYYDVTSFLMYKHEIEFESNIMMSSNSGALRLASLKNIFLSLTQNSKTIYLKVVNYQLKNSGPYYRGMSFKDLYMQCREDFVVSSDLALRSQLGEFVDHKILKIKRGNADGMEYLIVPVFSTLLQQFIEENV